MKNVMDYHLSNESVSMENPTVIYLRDDHAIYWLGYFDNTAFRCNVYLIKDKNKAWIVDPGNRLFFNTIKSRVEQIISVTHLDGLIICHQDPDVAASMVDWLAICPELKVFTTPRTQVLLPHYGVNDYHYVDVEASPVLHLPSGAKLQFIQAPFLHFSGAFTTYDDKAQALFSGDIFAALDIHWRLFVEDFNEHILKLDLFHKDYMASNLAARGFIERIKDIPMKAILPQHGSIITYKDVDSALQYLRELRCGTDIIYANLENT